MQRFLETPLIDSTVRYLKTNIRKDKCWDVNSACYVYIHKYCMNEKGKIYCTIVHAPCFELAKRKSSGYSTKIREK
jgi:hypothetical protein